MYGIVNSFQIVVRSSTLMCCNLICEVAFSVCDEASLAWEEEY